MAPVAGIHHVDVVAARRREMLRVARQDAGLRDAHYAMACLDEALASDLAGDRAAAAALWERAANELPAQAPQATLCAGARGQLAPGEVAAWAAVQRPVHAAMGYLIAALRAGHADQAATWRAEARRLAHPALPWLYYYLTYGPGADPTVPRSAAQEQTP